MATTWIAFDLNGTLTDLRPLVPGHPEIGPAALDEAVMLAMADTLSGGHTPLPEQLTESARRLLVQAGLDPREADEVPDRAGRLPAQPGAREALQTLARLDGVRLAVVTNSRAAAGRRSLEGAGLDDLFDAVVGTDGVGAFKPDPRVYRNAERELGAAPGELWLVAAHAWDLMGAKRCGWSTAWSGHHEQHLVATIPEPDVQGPTLGHVATELAKRLTKPADGR